MKDFLEGEESVLDLVRRDGRVCADPGCGAVTAQQIVGMITGERNVRINK